MRSGPKAWEESLRDSANLVLGPSTPSVHKGPETAAPPIKTPAGWLLVISPETSNSEGEWTISALLLDLKDPAKVVGALPEPIVRASEPRDDGPVCHSCVFPRGAIVVGNDLYIYHGTGDNGCALSVCPLDRVMSAFRPM